MCVVFRGHDDDDNVDDDNVDDDKGKPNRVDEQGRCVQRPSSRLA